MLLLLYKLLPLIPALSGLYNFLKLSGIIVYADPQKQTDYEDFIKKGNGCLRFFPYFPSLYFSICLSEGCCNHFLKQIRLYPFYES